MRKRSAFLAIIVLFISVLLLENCKHDPTIPRSPYSDADTLYVGRPYVFPVIPPQLKGYRSIIIPADNPMTYEGVQLGRMLFYDSTLSLNHAISCGSCHKQQFAFGDNQPLSQNVLGSTVRNTPALMNLAMNGHISSQKFFWDGRQTSIETSVDDALNHELRPDFTYVIHYLSNTPQYAYLFKKAFGRPGDITAANIEKAIAQFVRTLISINSRVDLYYRGELALTPAESAGLASITVPVNPDGSNAGLVADCFHCHTDGPYSTFANEILLVQNNGLDSSATFTGFPDLGYGAVSGNYRDNGKFKIPSLRNVAVSGPYMHDGRFATLDQVIGHYSEGLKNSPTVEPANLQFVASGGVHLSAIGKTNLLAFLNALTDTSYLHNPALSNPFH